MKKFEICFQLETTNYYIVPSLLKPEMPNIKWDKKGNIQFEYHYDFMPSGILPRFIVRTNDLLHENTYWKNGALLNREKAYALVFSEPLNRKIIVKVRGAKKRELLEIIRREIENIHSSLNNPFVKEMIPCICEDCMRSPKPYMHNFTFLQGCLDNSVEKVPCQNSFQYIFVEALMNGVKDEINKNYMKKFISAAKIDDAIQLLGQYNIDITHKNSLTLISSRWNALKKEIIGGTISPDAQKTEQNRITRDLLSLIDEL
jgi:internalin A